MVSKKSLIALGLAGGMCMVMAPVLTLHAQEGQQGYDESAMMEAWMALGTPGEHHEYLQKWVGEWDLAITSWMAPGAEPETMTSTSKAHVIMGGRYLSEHVNGTFEMDGEEMPFEGGALMGYDNQKEKFFSLWIDNFSTGVMEEWGTLNDDGQIVMHGEMYNPMFGQTVKTKSIATIVDADTRKLEMWHDFPGQGMFKHMEITYTRKQ